MGEVFETTDVELAEDLLLRHYGTSVRIRAHGPQSGMRLAHPAAVRRAVAFIEDNAERDISAADVARAAQVSIRAVQLAFARHLETTPLAYVRRVRLDCAHRDLLAADPARRTVAGVAYRWGFHSPGRFAVLYRQAYGVPPSHTIHQN
jgi:transcriptional regulator GlxA family with amidase domain